jgi:hypothetical protein
MTPADAAEVLGVAAAFDRRTVGRADAEAWADTLNGIRLEDAMQAVKNHYASSREFIYPSDVLAIVKTIRQERVRAAGNLTERIPLAISSMEDGLEQHEAERAWLRETARRVADGEHIDDVAPRLQLVPGDPQRIREITANIAKAKRAEGTRPRDEGETA